MMGERLNARRRRNAVCSRADRERASRLMERMPSSVASASITLVVGEAFVVWGRMVKGVILDVLRVAPCCGKSWLIYSVR